MRDLRLQAADRRLVGAAGKVGHDAQRIGRIKNRKVRLVAERPRLLAQNAHTQRMEGGNGQPLRPATQQLFDALPHLPRRLVGKSDGGDRRRRQAARADQISNFFRDDARLARPRAGQHEQRAVEIMNRFPLGRIELYGHRGETLLQQ